jgi:hypothetical protein
MTPAAACRLVVLGALLALGACRSRAAEDPASAFDSGFVGRWESVGVSPDGVGGVLDLAEDGTCVAGAAVFLDGEYQVDGGRLRVRSGDGGEPVESDVSVSGGRMLTGGIERERQGGDSSAGIVGTWTYWHSTGGTAYERYGEDGRMSFRLTRPGATRGTWSVSDGVLTLSLGASKPFAARRSGAELTLTAAGDAPRVFRRAERWWPFP